MWWVWCVHEKLYWEDGEHGFTTSCLHLLGLPPEVSIYRICSIRRRGYYLFHCAILCGFYSRAATNRERRLLNSSVLSKNFHNCKGFEKSQFYSMNCDAAWSAAGLLQSGTYTALPIRFLVFFKWFHTMIALRASKNAELLWTACILVPIVYSFDIAIWAWGLFTWACATRILAAASIRERRLFCSAHPEVRRQFKSSD